MTKPNPISQEEKSKIAEVLSAKIKKWQCPMCETNKWSLSDGYFNLFVSNDVKQAQIGGLNIPAIGLICDNCGYISIHALGSIGLLKTES